MAEDGPLRRAEFEGYIRRHETDPFAHPALVAQAGAPGILARAQADSRLSALERWQQRIVGAVAMLTFLVTAGVIAGVIELLRR